MKKTRQHKAPHKIKGEYFWAIRCRLGFYSGTWLRRRDAMIQHHAIAQLENEGFAAFWRRRRREHGDKAVKVRLVEIR